MITCPVCGGVATLMARHADGDLYRCPTCTHCFSDPNLTTLPTYAPEYFEVEHQRWFANPNVGLFSAIAGTIPRGASVLDAGCGRGDFLRFVRSIRPDLALTGIDLSLNQDVSGIRFLQGDFLETPIDRRFDAVVSLQVIEHVADVRAFVGRLRALTTTNGTVTVSTVNESSLLYGLARIGNRLGMPLAFNRLYSRQHLHHFTTTSLRTLLEQWGLRIEFEMTHNAPLAAIDIPVSSRFADAILRSGMWLVCKAGDATGRAYLQTIACRNSDAAAAETEGRYHGRKALLSQRA
jgi:SAM-dependent methyltransferase